VTVTDLTFEWTGDPMDEMFCRFGDYHLHVECMGGGRNPDDPTDRETWWCAVDRGEWVPDVGSESILNSADAGIVPLTLAAARNLAEMAVLADLYRRANR
jgi:hypothetical protein